MKSTLRIRNSFFQDANLKIVLITWLMSFIGTVTPMLIVSMMRNRALSSLFANWDAGFILNITKMGYIDKLPLDADGRIIVNQDAFFPLFPYLNRWFDRLLPGGPIVSGVFLNSVLWFFTLIIFYKFACKIITVSKAKIATMFFGLFPGSFINFWAYSESLTIFLIVIALYYISEERFLLCSIFIGIATLSRPNALPYAILVPSYIVFTIIKNQDIEFKEKMLLILYRLPMIIIYFIVSAIGFIGFNIYLWRLTNIPNAWFRIEREAWGESLKPFGELKLYMSRFIRGDWEVRVFVVIISAFIGITCLSLLTIYVKRTSFNPRVTAMLLPAAIVILLGLSNGPAVASLRFTLVAVPIFISIGYICSKRIATYVLPMSFLLMVSFCFLYSWGFNSPYYMGSP